MEKYDIGIIGAGPAGYVAAIYAARSGKSVALFEKDQVGGTCLNRGCIPTKALLSSIEALNYIKAGPSFGIEVAAYKVNFESINKRKEEIVKRLRHGIDTLLKARKITLFKGSAKLVNKNTIDVANYRVVADDIIIATGSSPFELSSLRFNHKNILSSDDALELKDIPANLLIVGGGAIGCEFAVIYNELGSKVTIVEMMEEILPNIDREIAKRLNFILTKKGITILTTLNVKQLKEEADNVLAIFSSGEERSFNKVLICVGRKPNLDGIGIEEVGLNTKDGKLLTDERMRTNIPRIYAIGDVTNRFQLAHVASYEGIIACENILGNKKTADYKSVPNCIYTEPEVASVGISEQAALRANLDVKVARFPFLGLGKAHVTAKTDGFVKLIGDKKTNRILGAHILGADATNVIAEAVLAIKKDLTVEELSETIHAHPTFSEVLLEACHIFNEKGIHML